jgi:hypothetical protein
MMDLINSQLTDPFRIGLLIALFITMLRTRAATGTVLPLAAGLVFVAVLVPSTMGDGFVLQTILAGLVSNTVIVAAILGIWAIYQRAKPK